MGKEEEKNPNPIYLIPDLLEEIFLGLPLKSILKFKTVSKEWRSILESRSFTERRMEIQKKKKKRKILAVVGVGEHRTESRFEEEEIEIVYLHSNDAATRPSLTCDGLICIPVPNFVNVLNPSTGEFISYPSGPDPVPNRHGFQRAIGYWWILFPSSRVMGFGKDIVTGHYKVVRLFFDPIHSCEILDLSIGEWRNVFPPPSYTVDPRRKSACVNGSIYWLEMFRSLNILAFDLHTEEFHDISPPRVCTVSDQLVNLEDRLTITRARVRPAWVVEIWIMDEEENWSMTHNISVREDPLRLWFRAVAISEQGNLFLHDNEKRLFKYYPETDELCCLDHDISVISPFVENLVSFRSYSVVGKTSEYRSGLHYLEKRPESWISKLQIPNIWFTTTLMSLVIFSCVVVSSRS